MKQPLRLRTAMRFLGRALLTNAAAVAILAGVAIVPVGAHAQDTEAAAAPVGQPSAADYDSIQAAIEANPGVPVFVPAGVHRITERIQIDHDGGGLFGPGTIVQENPEQPIVRVDDANRVRLEGVTLTRAEGRQDTQEDGIYADGCRNLRVANVRVINNRSRAAAVTLLECVESHVVNCLVENYSKIDVDDRTNNPELGYAFHAITGTGIKIRACVGTLVSGNTVVERDLRPTPELKERHDLGTIYKKNEQRGRLIAARHWDADYFPAWHQGSAIVVNPSPETDYTRLIGNHIRNAAQGIDIHSDHVVVADNIIENAFLGMKAMHGSRNVIITGNQFTRNDLWSILLVPGSASHAAAEGRPANVDGASIIANNIISDFGYGDSYWIWKGSDDSPGHGCPIALKAGPVPEENPPLRNVIVQGNVVYDTGRDQVLVDGQPRKVPPRYPYALFIDTGAGAPENLHISNNMLMPGTEGISNVALDRVAP